MWYVQLVTVATTWLLLVTDRMALLLLLNNNTNKNRYVLNISTTTPDSFNESIKSLELNDQGDSGMEVIEEDRWDVPGYKLGDSCLDRCYENLTNVICNMSTKTCQCHSSHPIALDDSICLRPIILGETCEHSQSCLSTDPYSTCAYVTQFHSKCSCQNNYRAVVSRIGRQKCVRDDSALTDGDITSVFALGIGLALFTGLTCLVLRLFSRARFGQQRCRYANANLTPPMMMTGMSTPASISASRRSSTRSGSTPGSRRPSYSMLVTPSRPGSRRPSVGSVRSQVSVRSYNRHDRSHDPLRLTMSAPPIRHDLQSPSNNIRILEQKFAQHAGYFPRRETQEKFERELWSRHSSFEIIADVISEAPEKA